MLLLAIGLVVGFIFGAIEGRILGSKVLDEVHAIRSDVNTKVAEVVTAVKGKL